jgi:hypothetical protein
MLCLISALSATMRYVVDFVSLLLLPAILLWFYLESQIEGQRIKQFLLGFFQQFSSFTVAFLISVLA